MRRHIKKLQQGQNYLTARIGSRRRRPRGRSGRLALAARKKLGATTATLLLQAQAAQLAQDHRTARALFRAMIEDPESAVLGYRGMIMEARRDGNWEEVERLTNDVRRLDANMPWLDWIRFEAATRKLIGTRRVRRSPGCNRRASLNPIRCAATARRCSSRNRKAEAAGGKFAEAL